MKKILLIGVLAITNAFSATLTPVQLINPAGSSAGQAVISAGPASAPAWGNVTLSGVTGVLPISKGGTGAITAAAALTNLGAASLAANTFTGAQTAPTFVSTSTTNSTSTTTGAVVTAGGIGVAQDIYAGGSYHGAAAITAGSISNTPISGSSGSFTTLAASGLITPSATFGIKGVTTGGNVNAGSVGEPYNTSASGVSMTSGSYLNVVTGSLSAGDWDCTGTVTFNPAATTTMTFLNVGWSLSPNGTPTTGNFTGLALSFTTGAAQTLAAPRYRVSASSATSIYLVANPGFATSTMTAGGSIYCRRAV
ncbi:hypothetical protein FOC27_09460 [Burkholderia multivorans]|nr:hypothetical protein [Burkholderia multivorans]QGR60433.1 hypothetical protein FOC27_09460 [Burkholderia multivorans]